MQGRPVRSAIYSGPGKSGICVCGCKWDKHHLGIVMRPGAEFTSGGIEGYIPQECERYGCNEDGGMKDGKPHCFSYQDRGQA